LVCAVDEAATGRPPELAPFEHKYFGETTVIRELIPYIDEHYRTIASDVFSSIVAFAGWYFPLWR
jgi:hypothetical protein